MAAGHHDFQLQQWLLGRSISYLQHRDGNSKRSLLYFYFLKKLLYKPRERQPITVCGQVSELSSKLVSRIAQWIKHVLLFFSCRYSLSCITCPHTSLPLSFQMVFFYSQRETMADKNAWIIWFISGVSAGGVTWRLFVGSALVASVCFSKD